MFDEASVYFQRNEDVVVEFQKEINESYSPIALTLDAPRARLRYTLGVPHPAHRCLAEIGDVFSFHDPRDFDLQLSYPMIGLGGYVDFIEVIVDQNHNYGTAHVVAGGLGQSYVNIVVKADNVSFFAYKTTIFGYNPPEEMKFM